MLGWIFFSIYIGAEFPKRSAWAEAQSLLLAIVHLLNLKNGADAIKTESTADGIFLRVAPEKFRSFIARSHWIDGRRYKKFLNLAQNKSFADAI